MTGIDSWGQKGVELTTKTPTCHIFSVNSVHYRCSCAKNSRVQFFQRINGYSLLKRGQADNQDTILLDIMHVAGWGSHSNRERLILQLANTHCFTREHFQCDYAKFTCGCKTKLKISTRISFNIQYQRIPYCVHGFAFLFIGLKKSHTHMRWWCLRQIWVVSSQYVVLFVSIKEFIIVSRTDASIVFVNGVITGTGTDEQCIYIWLLLQEGDTQWRLHVRIYYIDIWSDCIGYMDIWQMHLSDCKWGYMIYKKI